MKKKIFILLGVLLCSQTLIFSQVDKDLSLGEKISYDSKIFGETRELFVSMPQDYDSLKSYPVLYILFPEYSFYRAKAAARYLEGSNGIPGMILIGICDKDGGAEVFPFERRGIRTPKGDMFLKSIKNEVIPFVENKYLTDSLRILAGFSNSAMFANYLMVKEPDLFTSYIFSSPMIGWGGNFVLRQTTEFFNSIDSFNKTIYVIYGENDFDHVLNPMPAYEKLFSEKAPKGLKWKIDFLEDDGHVPFIDVYNGIAYTFKELGYKPQESIFDACTDGDYETVEKILGENSTWVDSTIGGTATPLMIASLYGYDSIVSLLLQNNADINYQIPNSGNSLQYALFRNKLSTIQLLIDKGIDVNNPGRNKQTALHMALSRRRYKIYDALIAANCDINAQDVNGNTALHYSIENNLDSISKCLIDAGADLKLLNNDKKSALFVAIENNNRDLVDLLKQKKSELPQDKQKMNELLQLAIKNNFQAIVTELSENGAELSGIDNKGRNLLHLATIGGNIECVKILLDKEFDVNVIDSLNRTALHYSAEQNNVDIAKLLLENGADINKLDYTNRTALALANDWGSDKVSEFFMDNGATVFKSDIIELEGAVNKKSEIKVTYIANMGFMVSSASKTVLIDALFDQSFGSYLTPSKQIVEKINQLEKPFNSVDLMLVTHDNGDHFSTNMVAEYLTKNKKAKVLCNKSVSSKLKENKNIKVDSSRIVGITPELYKSVDTKLNGIEIKVLRLRHSGGDGRTENIGFLFYLDGIKVLHVGDASGRVWKGAVVSGIEEYDAIGLKNMQIDVAILNRGSLWGVDAPGIDIIEKHIKPKHIILGHFSKGNKDGEEEVFRTIEKLKNSLPSVTILEESMQSIIYANFITENNQIKSYPDTVWVNRKFNPNWQQPIPGDTPEIFLLEIVSVKGKNTHVCTFSPDGKQLYFSRYPDRKSFVMTFENGHWSNPQEAFFNGKETSISSSNEKLFYYRDGDIYFNKKTEEGWGNAINVGKDINTAEMEYYPSVTYDETLFFSRNGNWEESRIMYSTFKNGKYTPPVDIGFPVNNGGASHAYVAPDKRYMIFNSPRKGSYTKLDLWISFCNENDIWTNPQNLGKTINSGGDAILCPTVSPDGKYLFFTRLQKDGTGYICWVSAKIIDRIRKQIMK